jgi:hydrophobic/amphiphilic exporter-1 (mainly G- bacteria), HAE1 family
MWMTRTAIDHPVFATMVMAALAVLGLFSYAQLGVEAMPDVRPPFVTVTVAYPGASPEQVENDVAKPIEEAVNSIGGVKLIRSLSREGLNLTGIEFRLDADLARSIQEVRDRVAQVRASFPREVKEPVVERVNTDNDEPVAFYGLLGRDRTQRDLTLLAEQVVRRGLQRAPGVGRVDLSGAVTRQVQIRVDAGRLNAYGLTVDQVVAALRDANVSVPVGLVIGSTSEAIVRVDGREKSVSQFADVVVARRGTATILLGQVAQVVDGEREPDSLFRIDGERAIGFSVYKAQDANIVATGRALQQAAETMRPLLPADVQLRLLEAQSDFVENSVDNVKRTIIQGALLTVLIVFMFLGSWRSTVITGLTLPIAVIATLAAIYAFGFTLNYMTLMAMSLCIGLLIDDAIVVRENIVRHIRMGKSHRVAAREGTEEVGLAVLATTLSIVAVFVPIAFMHGLVGKFFFPFGITVAVAVLVSLFVSFTLDPMLSAIWPDPPGRLQSLRGIGPLLRGFERLQQRLQTRYCATLEWALNHRRTTLGVAVASLAVAVPLFGVVGTEFLPQSDQSFISLRLTMPVGSSLDYASARAQRVEERLHALTEIRAVDTQIGTDDGRNTARVNLHLVPRSQRSRSQKDLESEIRRIVAGLPGVELALGWDVPIYVNLLGQDLTQMGLVMRDFRTKVEAIAGIRDISISLKEGTPAVSLRLKPDLAAEYGISHAQLGTTLRALVGGENSGYWLAPDGQNYEVVTQLPRASRTVAEDLANLNIATGRVMADGSAELVPLHAIATVEHTFNPENVRRQDLQRRVALWASTEGRPSGDVGKDVQALAKAYPLPPGLRFQVNGAVEDQDEATAAIGAALLLAVIFIYIVLASQFGSFLQPVAIMASLPLSVVGVALALLATRTTLNIFSMIGIVFLMGLVTKNAILLVDFANRGQRSGMSQRQALLAAGQIRLRPILMTTAAMVFGMLPLALGLGEGAEEQAPMGRAIMGGVLTSTLLTLIVVPVLYSYLNGWERRWSAARRARAALASDSAGSAHPG